MGYASLFPCIALTTETHMLKPFPQRVEATYLYLKEVSLWAKKNSRTLKNVRKQALEFILKKISSMHTIIKQQKKKTAFYSRDLNMLIKKVKSLD